MAPVHPVYARAAASSSQPLATSAAIQLLSQGANAAEASVALGAVLAVVEPTSNGLGGDAISLYHTPASDTTQCILGVGRSPALLTPHLFQSKTVLGKDGFRRVPRSSPHAVTVPGTVDAWCEILERFGSGKVTRAQVFEPAIRAAEQGFPVAPVTAAYWASNEQFLKQVSASHPMLVRDEGAEGGYRAPRTGEMFRNSAVAEVLKAVVAHGSSAFYSGKVAQDVVDAVQQRGGVLSMADMAAHRTEVCEPISIRYGGYEIYESPSPTQGIVALQALRILERIGCKIDRDCPESVHLMVEALRVSFADASKHIGDGTTLEDCRTRLSNEYIDKLSEGLCKERKSEVQYENVLPEGGTVQFCVIDADGNAMSCVQSNAQGFGTAIPTSYGFTLQNRGLNFNCNAGSANYVGGGKRSFHTIIPGMAISDNKCIAFGVMGGFMQPQGHLQVITGLIDEGLDPQQVLNRSRFRVTGGFSALEEGYAQDGVLIEEGDEDNAVWQGLRDRGHVLSIAARTKFGKGGVIIREGETQVVSAGCDARGDGSAMGIV